MMWAQRQRWAAQLLKEVERKGASGLLQLRLFLAGEVGQHGWAVDAVCGEGEDAEQFVCMMAELACRETTSAVRTAGLYEVQLAQFWLRKLRLDIKCTVSLEELMDVAAEYRQEVEDLERNEVWRDLFRTGCGTKAEKKESPGRLPKLSAAVIWTSWTVCWIVTMLASTKEEKGGGRRLARAKAWGCSR